MNRNLVLALAFGPLALCAANEKPKLTRPTITHAPKSAIVNKLEEFQFCLGDQRRIDFLNDFLKFQKLDLAEPELQVLCKILYDLNAKNDPIVPSLKISKEWREYLAKFNEGLRKLFDAIDCAQPKEVAKSTEEPENAWLTKIKEVSEKYAKENRIDCISRADVEDALPALKYILYPEEALKHIAKHRNTFSPIAFQFACCLLARKYSDIINSSNEPHKLYPANPQKTEMLLEDTQAVHNHALIPFENVIPSDYKPETRRFLKKNQIVES